VAQGLEELLKNRDSIECLVLAPGCYDCAHIGHLKYFKEAKKLGTLVVVVSADEFVKKGINRPAFKQEQRIEMISALEPVDYVILNDKVDCSELIHLLKPEIVVKGNEYLHKNTPQLGAENDALCSTGGKMVYLDTQLSSSSFLINNYMSNLPETTTAFLQEFKKKYEFKTIQQFILDSYRPKITIIGETILDEYIFGNVLGKSSKHPSLVFQNSRSDLYLGGVLAVARHLATFAETVEVITYIGENEEYKIQILSESIPHNVFVRAIRKKNSPTIVKRRYIDSYYQSRLFETYTINQDPLVKEDEDKVIELLPKSGDIIITDFGHGLITPRIIEQFYARYSRICANVQCNSGNFAFNLLSKYHDGTFYASVDTLEVQVLMGDRVAPIDELTKKIFQEEWTPTYLTVTKGKAGSTLYNSYNLEKHDCPAMTSKVVDSIGSGDTLFAISSLLMLNKCPLDIVNFVGSVAGAIGCTIIGNARGITKDELLENIEVLLK
jgi:cytidyltransferase-like protein